jgi:hypothetical protein
VAIISAVFSWLEDNPGVTTLIFAASILLLVVSLWAVRYFLISIPADYFNHRHRPLEAWKGSHPALRWSLLIGKNTLGLVLIVLGLIMFFTPGQGILTLLLGISLVDVPGKRAVERRIIARPTVLNVINHMRAKATQPPLVIRPHIEDLAGS